jgi:type II secretory pathway component PulF
MSGWSLGVKWRKFNKEKFFYEKSIYLRNGLGLVESLALSDDETEINIFTHLQGGETLADSFERAGAFTMREVSIIRLSEETGTIGEAFRGLYEDLKEERELSGKIRTVLIYPGILIAAVLLFLYTAAYYLVPPIHEMISGISGGNAILDLVMAFTSAVPASVSGMACLGIMAFAIRGIMDREKVFALVLGRKKAEYGEMMFIKEFNKLVSGGMDVCRAAELLDDGVFKGQGIMARLTKGEGLSDAFRKEGFSELLLRYIHMAEQTGDLPSALDSYVANRRTWFEDYLKRKTAMVEPIAVILMGLAVLASASVILLPMLDAYEAL